MPVSKDITEWMTRQNKRKDGGFIGIASSAPFIDIPRFSSGALDLDIALGGGWPRRRMSLIVGPESSGKTTACIRACSEIQKYCRVCWQHRTLCTCKKFTPSTALWCDAEGDFEKNWSIAHGFDPDDHVLFRPRYGEEAVDIITDSIRSEVFDLIILDSIEATVPAKECEQDSDSSMPGLHARLINKAYRVWNQAMMDVGKMAPTLIAVNQCRENIGKMFGDTMVIPGGKGQRFFSPVHVRLKSSKVHDIKDGTQHAYVEIGGSVPRNKTSVPRVDFTYNIAVQDYEEYGKGEINNPEAVIKYGRQAKWIKAVKGEWWVELDGKKMTTPAKGRDGLIQELRKEGEALYMILREKVLSEQVPK